MDDELNNVQEQSPYLSLSFSVSLLRHTIIIGDSKILMCDYMSYIILVYLTELCKNTIV